MKSVNLYSILFRTIIAASCNNFSTNLNVFKWVELILISLTGNKLKWVELILNIKSLKKIYFETKNIRLEMFENVPKYKTEFR